VPFHAGQTFLFPLNENNLTQHLWVIATEPNSEGLFAVVSFTSLKGAKDQTVILRKTDHPFLRWDTCIAYALADIVSADDLDAYCQRGRAKMHQDVTPEILRLILDGFSASELTKNRVRGFVRDYREAARPRTA
jgi:hypothetical protein